MKTIKGRLGSTFLITRQGRVYRESEGSYQPLPTHAGGPQGRYDVVCLDGKKHYVHRLVLTVFEGPAPEGCEASHVNDNPRDNRLQNLIWEPHKANCQRRKPGRKVDIRGTRNPHAKLSAAQVMGIYGLRSAGRSACSVAREFGCSDVTVGNIWKGRQWAAITGEACV